MRIAMSEGVEARAQQNVLRDAIRYSLRQLVFRVAAARDEEGAEGDGEGLVEFRRGAVDLFGVGLAEDGYGDGIIEDARWSVVDLVRGAAHGYAQSGSRWARGLHP